MRNRYVWVYWVLLMAVCLGVSGCGSDLLSGWLGDQEEDVQEKQEKIVSVSTLYDYAPYCFTTQPIEELRETLPPGSDSTILQGYSWDVFRESFHARGYTIELLVTDWVAAMDAVTGGQVDVLFPATKSAERQAIFYFSDESVNDAHLLVYVPQDSEIEWSGLDSLNGLRIGVVRGYNYGNEWNAHVLIDERQVDGVIQGFELLDAGELDGFAGYEVNWDYVLKQAGWETKYRKLPRFTSTYEYVIGLQTRPRSIELLRGYDSGKQQIVANGTFDRIASKW